MLPVSIRDGSVFLDGFSLCRIDYAVSASCLMTQGLQFGYASSSPMAADASLFAVAPDPYGTRRSSALLGILYLDGTVRLTSCVGFVLICIVFYPGAQGRTRAPTPRIELHKPRASSNQVHYAVFFHVVAQV